MNYSTTYKNTKYLVMAASHVIEAFRFVLAVWCTWCTLVPPIAGQTLDQNIQLKADNLNGYDRTFRPVLDQSNPISVNVSFDLMSLRDVDEVQEEFSVTGLLYLKWYDEKLTWDPATHGGIQSQLYSINDIWYPNMVLTNPSKGMKSTAQDWMTIRVDSSGFVLFVSLSMFEATCSIDVTYFPFDIQTCSLRFIPWGMETDEMVLRSELDTILQSFWMENGEWTLIGLAASDQLSINNNAVRFEFKFKRKPTFLLVNVVLPIVFMAIISVFVFVLPPDSGERISFSITVVLALAVFFTLIGDHLPKTSSPLSHLSYFLTIVLIYSVAMCIAAVFNLRLYFKEDESVPHLIVSTVNWIRCKKCTLRKHRKSTIKPHRGPVVLEEMDVTEKPHFDLQEERTETPIQQHPVSWKDVSSTIDTLCVILFSFAILITTVVYLYILTSNA